MLVTGSSFGPSFSTKLHVLAEGVGDHQDVREHDRRIETEPPDRLQRHLLGKPRRVAEVQERAGLFPDLAIFRQITSRLAHDPDRQRPDRFAVKDAENRFGGSGRSQALSKERKEIDLESVVSLGP